MTIQQSQSRMMDLPDLLAEISQGLVALPDFQRDFDWDESDVMKLLVTVLKGWPAGSLLLMQGRAKFFEVRAFEDGPSPRKDRLRFTVLDGQQRLTALYHAVYDRGSYVYSVKAAALESGSVDALEDGVEAVKRAEWDKKFRGLTWQLAGERIPLYVLKSPSDYFEWRDKVVAETAPGERDVVAARLSSIYRETLEAVHRYKFPAVSVEAELEPAAVSRIFERVNKTGLPLSTFDLMVARVYEPGWNLRVHWENARTNRLLIEPFLKEDGMPVLQAISLRETKNVRDSAVLDLPQTVIRNQWEEGIDAIESALEFLMRRCAVVRPEWLPYRAFVLVLAALARDHELERSRELLQRWFWSRTFALAFDAAANTRMVAEYVHLLDCIEAGTELDILPASYSTLFEASRRRQGAIWRGFLCALAYQDARDLSGTSLGIAVARKSFEPLGSHVVVAPVLPRDVQVPPRTEPAHLRVLNLILATKRTAGRVQEEYLADVADPSEDEHVADALAAQFLPPPDQLEDIEDDWENLLTERLERLRVFLEDNAGQRIERFADA